MTPGQLSPGEPVRPRPALPDLTALDGVTFTAHAVDIDSGRVLFSHDPHIVHRTASMGKVFLLHSALRMAVNGELDLDEKLRRRPSERVDESGIWYLLQQDSLSIFDIGMLIGAFSDNFATNVLIRRVGLERVAEETAALGYADSRLHDFLRWPRPAGAPVTLSSGTAADYADLFARISRSVLFDESHSEILRRWLGAGADTSMVASAFDPDPLAHYLYARQVWVVNKTGTDDRIRADAGIAQTPSTRVAYAVFANWEDGTDRVVDVLPVMRRLGDVIHAHLRPAVFANPAGRP